MHVVVLSDGYPPRQQGGAQRIAAQLAEGYRERGHQVDVIATAGQPATDGRTVEGVPVHRVYTPRPRALLPYLSVANPWTAPRVGRLVDELSPDVVHAHNVHWLSKEAIAQASRRGVPVVKTYHDAGTFAYGELGHQAFGYGPEDEEPPAAEAYEVNPLAQCRRTGPRWFPLRNRLNRAYLGRHVDEGVAVSRELARALQANGMPCSTVIPNGIDPGRMATPVDETALRQAVGIDQAPFALFGGRTGPVKGCRQLASAFARARERLDEDARLLVTGDSACLPAMRAEAGEHGEAIEATGWIERDELAAAFRAARVVATPSIHLDPFPTVNLEALAAGTPVVTTCMGGARELVRDGIDGRVVNPLNVDELAGALVELLGDPDRAAKLGQAGRERVEESFDLADQVQAYLDVLAQAARSPRETGEARPTPAVERPARTS